MIDPLQLLKRWQVKCDESNKVGLKLQETRVDVSDDSEWMRLVDEKSDLDVEVYELQLKLLEIARNMPEDAQSNTT